MTAKTKQATRPRAYLLRGDDDYRKHEDLTALLKSLVSPDFGDFDLEQMQGDSAGADRVVAGLNVPPFGSAQRVVLVRFANKMPTEEQEKLATVLEKTPESGCLILVTPAPEKADGRPKKGSDVVGDLSRAVRKVGEVREFGRMKADHAIPFAKRQFDNARKRIDAATLKTFVDRVGTDSSVIVSEAQKLVNYAGDSENVTSQMVATVASETPEEKVFKLLDAIGARNQPAAVRLLAELFETNDDPKADAPKTLATIARQLRLIWQAKMLVEAGVRRFDRGSVPEELKAALPSNPNVLDVLSRQNWQINRLTNQARAFSRDDLTRAFVAVARTDMLLKGAEEGPEDPQLLMEMLVIELSRPRARR